MAADPTAAPAALQRLQGMVQRVELRGPSGLEPEALVELPRLYRHASDELARAESGAGDPRRAAALRALVTRAHAVLHVPEREPAAGALRRALRFLLHDCPRAIRAEWKLGLALLAGFYGLSLLAYAVVRQDLEMAFVLFDPGNVATQIEQLRATEQGQPFRGNFTFGLGDSPHTAGWILAHNITVSILFFGSALLPPLFLLILAGNALMLGTYTAVAAHWGQAGAISSILWCHGVIELQMIVLAGMAGLVLVRAWVAPGPWTRAHAMGLESRRAWCLLAPTIPFLFLSGLIEGYVSPHAPTPVRLAVAGLSVFVLAAWIGLGGREPRPTGPR